MKYSKAAALLITAHLTSGCAPAQNIDAATAAPESVAASDAQDHQDHIDLPEGFPETINFPEGSRLVQASGGQPPEYSVRSYNLELETQDPVDSVVGFYQELLPRKGFEITSIEEGFATLIRFDAPGLDEASVRAMDAFGDGTTTISISIIMDSESADDQN